jgi:hypothetical protein
MASLVVYRGPSMLDGSPIVAILTFDSANVKTGPMAQLFIMHAEIAPHDAQKTGDDAAVCGDCPFRPIHAKVRGYTPCYVKVWQGPRSTWVANRAAPVRLSEARARIKADGVSVRLGAYGDPAALPQWLVQRLTSHAVGFTGYTHQWRDPRFAWLKGYVMASCDDASDYARATAEGWRTFRVLPKRALPVLAAREILCPSDVVECIDCGLCDGVQYANDRRKSIAIVAH